MLAPVTKNWQERPRDSFPLSYFPVFSYGLGDVQTEHYVAGWDARRNRYAIHHGDILLGDQMQAGLNRRRYTWPFEHVRPLLAADFVVGIHEGPITERSDNALPDRRWDYGAQPASATALAGVGFKAVGLSNNHVLYRGPEGLADTLRQLREAGIRPFGAGVAGEVSAPLLIDTPHGPVGVLVFGEPWQQGARPVLT